MNIRILGKEKIKIVISAMESCRAYFQLPRAGVPEYQKGFWFITWRVKKANKPGFPFSRHMNKAVDASNVW